MKRLYVIGNGFDVYHNMDTKYISFGLFLKNKYSDIYDKLVEYYGFPELNEKNIDRDREKLWSEFEDTLALLDSDTVLDEHIGYVANVSSPDFSDRDWGAFQIEIERFLKPLTEGLFEVFREFSSVLNTLRYHAI